MFRQLLDPPMSFSSSPPAFDSTVPSLVELAAGRIVELCSGVDVAQTSAVLALIFTLQQRGEHVAWVAPRGAGLFPPDWQRAGIDLDAMLVVHVPASDARAAPRAAELLLRTGVMGAVVLDLSNLVARATRSSTSSRRDDNVLRGEAWMGRLLGLAREHGTRLVLLSPHGSEQPSLGPLVSVRLAVRRASDAGGLIRDDAGRLTLATEVLKDKSGVVPTAPSTEAVIAANAEPGAAARTGAGDLEPDDLELWRRAG